MRCTNPLQAVFLNSSNLDSGKSGIHILKDGRSLFKNNLLPDDAFGLPCGRCICCRLEKSRQWAMRIMHEASLYDDNCFVTLTYDDSKLPVNGSLNKEHMVNFMKKLRFKYVSKMPKLLSEKEAKTWSLEHGIRFFQCGEYGDRLGRPHHHACLFNHDFTDREFFGTNENGDKVYVSKSLIDLWGFGHCTVGSLTFESAAYVARYCTKKITGDKAESHYNGRVPEYATMSLKPGIGSRWYDSFKKDAYPSDYLVVRGSKCKPPRYYDNRFQEEFPDEFAVIKDNRMRVASSRLVDNTYRRLKDIEYCQEMRFKRLYRPLEG